MHINFTGKPVKFAKDEALRLALDLHCENQPQPSPSDLIPNSAAQWLCGESTYPPDKFQRSVKAHGKTRKHRAMKIIFLMVSLGCIKCTVLFLGWKWKCMPFISKGE